MTKVISTLEAAKRWRQQLLAELDHVETFIEACQTAGAADFVRNKVSGKANPKPEAVAAAALEAITAAGRPMKLDELYDTLVANGLRLEAKDPKKLLITKLWRSDRIKRDRLKGYSAT